MDETTTDVVPTEGGEQIAPQSEPSPEGTVQGSPGGESQIEALSQQVTELSGMVRAFQSDEDRRIPAIERQLKTQTEQLEAYHQRRKSGLSEQEAQRAEVLDQIVAERMTPAKDATVPPTAAPAAPTQVAVEDYLSPILQVSGLTANDADVIAIVRNERDPGKQKDAIVSLALARKQAKETPANPAAVLPSGSGQAVESGTLESITKELKEVLAMPATDATRDRVKELGKKQRELIPRE